MHGAQGIVDSYTVDAEMTAIRNPVKCRCGYLSAGHYGGFRECWGIDCPCPEYRPNALTVARWKVTRKTCGRCNRGFGDNIGSSICSKCLSELLGLT